MYSNNCTHNIVLFNKKSNKKERNQYKNSHLFHKLIKCQEKSFK